MKIGKLWLLSRLQSLFETGRIRLPKDEDRIEGLVDELLKFEVRQTTSGVATAQAATGHDDRVIALGLAVSQDFALRRIRVGRSLF